MCGTPTIFVLEHGQYFQSQLLEIHELEIIQHVQWNSLPPKQCYRNAQCLALKLYVTDHPHNVHYVEGFVSVDNSILIQHAWLSINNKLVDPTLRWPVNNIENYGEEFEEYT